MTVMVNKVGPVLGWTGLDVHMHKSQVIAFDHETGKQVAIDSISITLNGKPSHTLPPDESFKYLGVQATITSDSAKKVFDEMVKRLAALSEDRVLSCTEKDSIIVIAAALFFDTVLACLTGPALSRTTQLTIPDIVFIADYVGLSRHDFTVLDVACLIKDRIAEKIFQRDVGGQIRLIKTQHFTLKASTSFLAIGYTVKSAPKKFATKTI
jgi:hypothetical protein